MNVHKPFEHGFWQKWLKFYKKMDLPNQIRIICNIKHRQTIHLEFLEAKASICSTIKKIYFHIVVLFLHFSKLSQESYAMSLVYRTMCSVFYKKAQQLVLSYSTLKWLLWESLTDKKWQNYTMGNSLNTCSCFVCGKLCTACGQ